MLEDLRSDEHPAPDPGRVVTTRRPHTEEGTRALAGVSKGTDLIHECSTPMGLGLITPQRHLQIPSHWTLGFNMN